MGTHIKRWHTDIAKNARVLKKNSSLGNSPERKLRRIRAGSSCTLNGASLRKYRAGDSHMIRRNHISTGPVLSLNG